MSLVVINGILAYMLTPGQWTLTRGFWDGFFNETYWPALVARTFVAVGLAGLFAIWVASWLPDAGLRARIARDAAWRWVLPMAVAIPLSLVWYLGAAAGAGVPVAEIFGAKDGSLGALLTAVFSSGIATGYPVAQRAAWWVLVAAAALTLLTVLLAAVRSTSFGRPFAALLLVLGLVAMGGSEWVREDLRKPWVIGQYMFVNALRLPAPDGVPAPPAAFIERFGADRFTLDAVNASGVMKASAWVRPLPAHLLAPDAYAARAAHEGRELFRVLCSACHTMDGYQAIRPLVRGKSPEALAGVIGRLASPVDAAGNAAAWTALPVHVKTWRDRRMPPFAGTDEELQMLAAYLSIVGGADPSALGPPAPSGDVGKAYFDANCAACHSPDGLAPLDPRGRKPAEFYEMIGRLPEINEMMPPFEGTDDERRALADHIASLPGQTPKGGAQ
jgi:mono/diheme cytochrome c family protein